MSHDGDGKPPNPFATPGPGAPNPFDDIMGAAPAAAPNPFAATAVPSSSGASPDEPPAITVIKASRTDAPAPPTPAPSSAGEDVMASLGLDLAEPAAAPKAKAVRPELEEWRSGMTQGAAHSAEPPNFASVSNPRMQALAPPKKGGALKYVVAAVGVLVVLAAAGVGQRLLSGGDGATTATATKQGLSETDQLLELGIRPENAPDCFVRDRGFDFSYVDSGGQTVTVKSIADVPFLYRMNAKCLPE